MRPCTGRSRWLRLLRARAGPLDRGLQYDDVRDAWNYYLAHDNQGRGFVLIGHSQGSYILTRLIREEIDGKPSRPAWFPPSFRARRSQWRAARIRAALSSMSRCAVPHRRPAA